MTKRFICGLGFPINSDDPIHIISDSVEDKDYYKFSDICNVLNEQQSTILFLQDEIDELKKDIDIYEYEEKKHSKTARKLYEENEQLRKELEKLKLLNESLGLFMNE